MRWSDEDGDDDEDDFRFRKEEPFSGLGIASFALSLVLSVLLFCLFAIAGYLENSTPGGIDENDPVTILLGLALIGGLLLELLAVALGIGALFQQNRKKVFAVLGIAWSSLVLFGGVILIFIGILLG